MKINIYQIDAFTEKVFAGNPAAVCPLRKWLAEDTMQKIAMENNLAETAFFVPEGDGFHIRWFTPSVEVDLCGHATLATAYVIFNYLGFSKDEIVFHSRSGELRVKRTGDLFILNFPMDQLEKTEAFPELLSPLNVPPQMVFKGRTDYMLVYRNQHEIIQLSPDFTSLAKVKARGIIVTAPGEEVDFVSRFFAPQSGINEDPVTGSAHTSLTPYWTNVLGKSELSAIQLSSRKGYLTCSLRGDRVEIGGKARIYLTGEIVIN